VTGRESLLQGGPKAVDLEEHLDPQLRHPEDQGEAPPIPVPISIDVK
jgi:hypothetical protein